MYYLAYSLETGLHKLMTENYNGRGCSLHIRHFVRHFNPLTNIQKVRYWFSFTQEEAKAEKKKKGSFSRVT
jgi:hypothetical protein